MENNKLLLDIHKDIEEVKTYLTEIKQNMDSKLDSLKKSVYERVQIEKGKKEKLDLDVEFAVKKFSDMEMRMYTVECYLDELAKKLLKIEEQSEQKNG
ncbi:hypothetical protein ABET51_12840 [Metabacillus fastidiosus]|uniref:hypothetical protein n=1 Tax=Metabacillus fastidiosus TaxID=1458 RepID=UPI003D2BD79E